MKSNLKSELQNALGAGRQVRAEVERQLLADLQHYGLRQCTLDWSETSAEGHKSAFLDGHLENWSGLQVIDKLGEVVAAGWMDFIHREGTDHEPVVYWAYLHVLESGQGYGKEDPGIPIHVWKKLPEEMKQWCASQTQWKNDPLVQAWKKSNP